MKKPEEFSCELEDSIIKYELMSIFEDIVSEMSETIWEGAIEYGLNQDNDWYELDAVVPNAFIDKIMAILKLESPKKTSRSTNYKQKFMREAWKKFMRALFPGMVISVQDIDIKQHQSKIKTFVGDIPGGYDKSKKLIAAINKYSVAGIKAIKIKRETSNGLRQEKKDGFTKKSKAV